MARIRKAEEPQFTPGTPEFTMGQEQRRQARQEEEELQEMYRVLQDLSVSPDLSSSERQEVDDKAIYSMRHPALEQKGKQLNIYCQRYARAN